MGKKKKFKGVSKLNKQKPTTANTTLNEKFGIQSSGDKLIVSNSLKDTITRMPESDHTPTITINPLFGIKEKEIPNTGKGRADRRLGKSPSADFDADSFQGKPPVPRLVPGISTFLTNAEIDDLHRGEFVLSGGYTTGMELSQKDPFFYAVRGEPNGTVIANSAGSVLLPKVKIPLGSKFDYRF